MEEYRYKLAQISFGDFTKIMKRLKNLGDKSSGQNRGVFTDPLKKKIDRAAKRTVLTPTDRFGNEIPPTKDPSEIHPRQTSVAKNKEYEIDKDGNLIKESMVLLRSKIRKIVEETIREIALEKMI